MEMIDLETCIVYKTSIYGESAAVAAAAANFYVTASSKLDCREVQRCAAYPIMLRMSKLS